MKINSFIFLGGTVAMSNGLPYILGLAVAVFAPYEDYAEFSFLLNGIIVSSVFLGYVSHTSISNGYYRTNPENRQNLLIQSVFITVVNFIVISTLILLGGLLNSSIDIYFFLSALIGGLGLFLYRLVSVYVQMEQVPKKLFALSSTFCIFCIMILISTWYIRKSVFISLALAFVLSGILILANIVIRNFHKRNALSNRRYLLFFKEYAKHIRGYSLIFVDAILSILFSFLDKVFVKLHFDEMLLAGYYFSFTYAMIFSLFSELLMKDIMPKLMVLYSSKNLVASKENIFRIRVRYTLSMIGFLIVFYVAYDLVVVYISQYRFTQKFIIYMLFSVFILSQIKFDNVFLVAFKKGGALVAANCSSFIIYLAILFFSNINSIEKLAFIYSLCVFVWWGVLFLLKQYLFIKLRDEKYIF